MKLILASQSPYRRRLLEGAHLSFQAVSPSINEQEVKEQFKRTHAVYSGAELALHLAKAKAESVARSHDNCLVIGSDQLVWFKGQALDKPGSHDRAVQQLRALRGEEHELLTTLVLIGTQAKTFSCVDRTRIRLRNLSDALIERYVQLDQPLDCAGSYKIEQAGALLIETLDTFDPSAIQGLPLIALVRGLGELGFSVEDFWRQT